VTVNWGSIIAIGLVMFFLAVLFINIPGNTNSEPAPVYADVRATPAGHHALVRLYSGSDGYWTMLVTHTDGESFAQHLRVHDSTAALINDAASYWEGVAHALISDYDYDQIQRG
jgi:hypothetical protein